MPIVPTKWDTLNRSREEYIGHYPQFPGDRDQFAFSSPEYKAWMDQARPEFEATRQREHDWDRAARNAMATGRMTPEEVTALGYRPIGHETDGNWGAPKWGLWRPLPQALYHTTTNLPGVAASGRLLAPDELDLAGQGRGLGGGSQDTISFTDSPEEAENIRRAMLEGADVASGRLPIERLVEMARTGEGANEPWLQKMFGNNYDWSQGDPQGLHDLLHAKKRFSEYALPEGHPLKEPHAFPLGLKMLPAEQWAQHGYYPDDFSHHHDTRTDRLHGNVYRQMTPEEHHHAVFDWWRNPYAPMRQWSGGPGDPMFTSVDPQWFANLDPSHVGVVQAAPVPGGHGYPMSSLGEWRVPTGDAVQITHINGQPYQSRTASIKLASPLYQRWVFSPVSGEVMLADNSGNPLDVKYHSDLARELNEPNLIHGYAYRVGNGWRLTDWESKPVEDPFIIAQVMRALQANQAARKPEDGSWDPSYEEDWDRLHLGLPT